MTLWFARLLTATTLGIAIWAIWLGYSQKSALSLRSTEQHYGTRYGTSTSGRYYGGVWVYSPSRAEYGTFRGGGPGAGGK
ncbi:MAG: hypothetical protein ACFB9N_16440 [Geitlerinemataceae cyanobacterium]